MKAAVLYKLNEPLVICDVNLTELKVGQVLVKVLVSGLCGAQIQEIKGYKGNEKFLPHLMGHEGCGIVQDIGAGVQYVKPGDKVVMHWRTGRGIESVFPEYILDGRKLTSGKVVSFTEYAIVSENRVTTVPPQTCPYFAALLGCGMTTALGVINNEANLKFGESITVVGCGGVGLNLLQAAKLGGAYPIIGIDTSEGKKHLAFRAGASHYINVQTESIRDKFSQILRNGLVDIIVDTTGHPPIIEEIIALMSDRGRTILVGQPQPGKSIALNNAAALFLGEGKTLKATQGGRTDPSNDIPRYASLNIAGILIADNIITHKFKLSEINSAVSVLMQGAAGRVMIEL